MSLEDLEESIDKTKKTLEAMRLVSIATRRSALPYFPPSVGNNLQNMLQKNFEELQGNIQNNQQVEPDTPQLGPISLADYFSSFSL